ncbi:MAG: hypothetical protein MZV64_23670 [Ignavibacteriales bacterium]|nr:hypothetical protein [Ignavibacteriales bacterium]
MKDTRALLDGVSPLIELGARQPACQQNVHAIDPDSAPIHGADQSALPCGRGHGSQMRAPQRLTLDVRHREESVVDLDSSYSAAAPRTRRPHLAPLNLSIDLDDLYAPLIPTSGPASPAASTRTVSATHPA